MVENLFACAPGSVQVEASSGKLQPEAPERTMATASDSKVTLERIALVVGMAVSMAGAVSTWAVSQYRIDTLEAESKELRAEVKLLREEFHAQGERVKCLICQAHDLECPGC